MGCHPASESGVGGCPAGTHHVSFYCEGLDQTMAELKERGVEFTEGIEAAGWGRVTRFAMPGGVSVQLYQPRYLKKPSS